MNRVAAILCALLLASAQPTQAGPRQREWVLVYYMSYDNNLERCGRPILDMLGRGVTSDDLAVVCFADFTDSAGMLRYELTQDGERETRLRGVEASADEATLERCLDWVSERYPARRYGLVFLNHGGRLAEMCLDDDPGRGSQRRWLQVPKVADVVTDWRARTAGEVELLFLQQCGKGALANYHALRDAARYVMASQTVVGAPNYYYTPALAALAAEPSADGLQLARWIMEHETPNMFTTYTALAADALQELPRRLDAALAPLLDAKAAPTASPPPCFEAGQERFRDGLAWLSARYEAAGLDDAPLDRFSRWVRRELIAAHRVSPRRPDAEAWCGFSIFVPGSPAQLAPYRGEYALYRESQLDELLAGEASSAGADDRRGAGRLGPVDEALLRQAVAAGCDATRLEDMREILAERHDVRQRLKRLARLEGLGPGELRRVASETNQRTKACLKGLLGARLFAALDPRAARHEGDGQ